MWRLILACLAIAASLHAEVRDLRHGWSRQWTWSQSATGMGQDSVALPNYWSHQGCALYSTTLQLSSKSFQQALLVPAPLNASQVWINGQSVGGTGHASCNRNDAVPENRQRLYLVPEGVDKLDISILVSNYESTTGGIPHAPQIGSVLELFSQVQFKRSLSYLFAGILFLMGLYHVVLFLYRRKSHGNVIFSSLSFFGVYRLLGSSNVLSELFPIIPWDVWIRLDYASTGLFFALLYLFAHISLPGRLERTPGFISVFISMLYAFSVTVMPLVWLAPSLTYFLILSILGIFFILQAEIQAVRDQPSGRHIVLLITTSIFIMTLVNDILFTTHSIQTGYFAPFGLMPVVVGHWLTLAQEYGSSYSLAERRLDEFMKAMAKAISNKSQYTGEHIERVTRISMRIAQALGMPDAQQRQLHLGAVVHDLGKIHLPDDILDKPGELTPEELSKVQTHPYKGWEMLEHVEGLAIPRLIIRHHHENWDGSGYPDHLTGKRIPLEARIVALADHWDAITSVRAHRGAIPIDRARDMLHEEAGKKLDPDLVRIFLEKRLWSEDE